MFYRKNKDYTVALKYVKHIMLTFVFITGVLIVLYYFFVAFSPQFGGDISKEQKDNYEVFSNYRNGKFRNLIEIDKSRSFENIKSGILRNLSSHPGSKPEDKIPVEKLNYKDLNTLSTETKLSWLGHSSFILNMKGKIILIDPVFSNYVGPHKLLGKERFYEKEPIDLEKLSKIDFVIISHDHYDHLDYESILKIKDKVKRFYVPMGVGVHLLKWGVNKEQIVALNWWNEASFEDLQIICTPAQHFSGRKLDNSQETLWASWVLKSDQERIFFSGDTGYSSHFKEIGDRFGPFNVGLIECGQYNELWPNVHMLPEETVQTGIDIKAEKIIPIHWGAFKLSTHPWKDPVERFSATAKEKEIQIITPKIGELVRLNDAKIKNEAWWRNIQ